MFFLQKIPEGSVIVFHACAHNPTGVDPKVMFKKHIILGCKTSCSNRRLGKSI